jgi:hypothetical protein
MHEILLEIKSYCSVRNVGKRRVFYFLCWLYCENYIKMKELAYKFGVFHTANHAVVCASILNSFLSYGLLKQVKVNMNGIDVPVFRYKEELTPTVIKYLKTEKAWIEILKLKKADLDDF